MRPHLRSDILQNSSGNELVRAVGSASDVLTSVEYIHISLRDARPLKIFLGAVSSGIQVIIFGCGPSPHDIVMHAIYHGVEVVKRSLHRGYGYH